MTEEEVFPLLEKIGVIVQNETLNFQLRDCILASLNNAATAKYFLLNDAPKEEILKKLNWCLSWCFPLVGIDHPYLDAVDPSEPRMLLGHEGACLGGIYPQIANKSHPK